jgi:hypothetical protein
MHTVRLQQAGVPVHRRFSFYDQIHTTGMDIHQCIDSKAAITLGKDMTFRDYAQGAFRMRGIGQGEFIRRGNTSSSNPTNGGFVLIIFVQDKP